MDKHKHPSGNRKTIPHCGCRLPLHELDVITNHHFIHGASPSKRGDIAPQLLFGLGQKTLFTVGNQ